MPRRKVAKFPGYIRTERNGSIRWCFFDSDGYIARTPTNFANSLQDNVPHGLSQGTVETYVSDLMSTLPWMRDVLPIRLADGIISFDKMIEIVEREHVEKTVKSMAESEVGQGTIARREVVLKALFEWCSTQKAGPIRVEHPYSEVKERIVRPGVSVGSQRDIDEFINFETVKRILSNLHNECERVLFHFMFDVGPRISESIDMTADMLPRLNEQQRRAGTLDDYYNLSQRDLYLPAKIKARKKRGITRPTRQVVISLPTMKRIEKYHRTLEYIKGIERLGFKMSSQDRPVFLTSNGSLWQKRNALKQFRAAILRADLPGWLVVHALRSGAAYLILVSEDMGKTFTDRLKEAKKQLGHAQMKTLEQYYTTLPAPLLKRFQNAAQDNLKWKYLFDLFEDTYLTPRQHNEKRGKRLV